MSDIGETPRYSELDGEKRFSSDYPKTAPKLHTHSSYHPPLLYLSPTSHWITEPRPTIFVMFRNLIPRATTRPLLRPASQSPNTFRASPSTFYLVDRSQQRRGFATPTGTFRGYWARAVTAADSLVQRKRTSSSSVAVLLDMSQQSKLARKGSRYIYTSIDITHLSNRRPADPLRL